MKKLALLLLALPLAISTTPVIAPAFAFPPISPHEALFNEGEAVTVEGIASIRKDPQRLGIDIDLDGEHSPFLGYIIAGHDAQFPNLASYAGKMVDITGVVQFYLGRAEVKMTSAKQLKLASPNNMTNEQPYRGQGHYP
jgi:DNA/RNA endonuclease YhcR with UshA esterase domain